MISMCSTDKSNMDLELNDGELMKVSHFFK